MKLKNTTGDVLEVPAVRATVEPGEEFDCPDELAGEVPDVWRAPTEAEAAEGCRGLVTRIENGEREVLSPGSGLLSTRNFEIVPAAKPGRKATAAPAPTDNEKEGE